VRAPIVRRPDPSGNNRSTPLASRATKVTVS
jgi:hypothetical protein